MVKRYTFVRGSYLVRLSHIIRNGGDQVWKGALFGRLLRDGSEDPSTNNVGFAPMPTYLGGAYWRSDQPYNKIDFDDIEENEATLAANERNKGVLLTTEEGGWVAMLQHYFVTAWIPQADDTNQVQTRKDSQGNYIVGFTSSALQIPAGTKGETGAVLYAGPKLQEYLGSNWRAVRRPKRVAA